MDADIFSKALEREESHPRGSRGGRRPNKSKIRSVKETIERVKERYRRAQIRTRGFGRRGSRGGMQPGRGNKKKRGTRGRSSRGGRARDFSRRNEYFNNDRSQFGAFDRERDNEDVEEVYGDSPPGRGYRRDQFDDELYEVPPDNYDNDFKGHFKERSASLDRGQRESYEKEIIHLDRDSEDEQRHEKVLRMYEEDWQNVLKERRELEDLRKAVEEERRKLELIKREVIEEEGENFRSRSLSNESDSSCKLNMRVAIPDFHENSKEKSFSEKVIPFKKPLLKAPSTSEVPPPSSNRMTAAGILLENRKDSDEAHASSNRMTAAGSLKNSSSSDEVHPSSNRMTAAGLLNYLAKSSVRSTKSHTEAPIREVDSTNRVRARDVNRDKDKSHKVDFDIMGGPRIPDFNASKKSGIDVIPKGFGSTQGKTVSNKLSHSNKDGYSDFSAEFKSHSQVVNQTLGDRFSSNRDDSFHDSSKIKFSKQSGRFYDDSGRVEDSRERYNLDHKEAGFHDWAKQSISDQQGERYNVEKRYSGGVFTDSLTENSGFNSRPRINDAVNVRGSLVDGSRASRTLDDGMRGGGFSELRGGVGPGRSSGFHQDMSKATGFHVRPKRVNEFNNESRRGGEFNDGSRRREDFNEGLRGGGEFNEELRRSGEFNEGLRKSGEFNEGSRRSREFNEGLRRGEFNEGLKRDGDFNEGLRRGREFNEELRSVGEFNEGLNRGGAYNQFRRGSEGINDGIKGGSGLNNEVKRGSERLNDMPLPRIGAPGLNDGLRRGGLGLNDGLRGAGELDRLRRGGEFNESMRVPTLNQREGEFNPNVMQRFSVNEKWGLNENFRGEFSSLQGRGGLSAKPGTSDGFDSIYSRSSGSGVLEPSSRGDFAQRVDSTQQVQFPQNFKDNIRNQGINREEIFPPGSMFNTSAYETIDRNDNKMEGNRGEMFPASARNFMKEEYPFRGAESTHSNFSYTDFEQTPANKLRHEPHIQDHLFGQSSQSAYPPGKSFDSSEFMNPDDIPSSSSNTSTTLIGRKTEDERIHKVLLRKKKRLLLAKAKLNPAQEKTRANLEKEIEEVEVVLQEIGAKLYEERQKAKLLHTSMRQF